MITPEEQQRHAKLAERAERGELEIIPGTIVRRDGSAMTEDELKQHSLLGLLPETRNADSSCC